MAVLLDTGIVYAFYDRSDAWHARARRLIRSEAGGLLLPAPVIPEVDHLLGTRLAARARQVFYQGLADGDYDVLDVPKTQYARIADLSQRFSDLELGFVDASLLVLSEVSGVRRIGTSDRRHFAALAGPFSLDLLP